MTTARCILVGITAALLVGCGVSAQDSPVRLGPTTPAPECVPEVSELTSTPASSAAETVSPSTADSDEASELCD